MERLYLLLAVSVILAGCTSGGGGETGERTERLQLPVGENAFGEQEFVNITDSVNPSVASIEGTERLVWRNQNNYTVLIKLEGVVRPFTVPAGEQISMKPAKSFNYDVSGRDGFIGSGRVEVG